MPIVVRTLTREYRLHPPDGAAARDFAFMAIEPEIVGAALAPVDLSIARTDGLYTLARPGGSVVAGGAAHLLAVLHGMVFRDVRAASPGAPLLHGATIVGPHGRMILVGSKGTGKTTLTLHLVALGWRVEGDEHLVIDAADVVARPRTLRIKPGTLALVPALADAVRRCPSVDSWDGLPIYAVAPSIAGLPWRIERGRLDHLVFLEANHGGRSMMRPIGPDEAMRRLLGEALLPPSGVAGAAARLRTLATTRPAWRLSVGDLDGAVRHLSRIGAVLS